MLKETSQELTAKIYWPSLANIGAAIVTQLLLFPFCRGARCHCPQAAGPGLCCLFCPPGGSQQPLPVLAGSPVLSTCLHDTAKLAFPRACPVRLFLSCLSLLLASQCAPEIEICCFSLFLHGFIYYLLMTSRGHSSDRFCYDDRNKTLRWLLGR